MPGGRAFLTTRNVPVRGLLPPLRGNLITWLDAVGERWRGAISGNALPTWHDRSELGADYSQTTGANQPLWIDGIRNCLPIVRFNGTNAYYTASLPGTISGSRTIISYANYTFLGQTTPLWDDNAQALRLFYKGGAGLQVGWRDSGGAHQIGAPVTGYNTQAWVFDAGAGTGTLYQQSAASSYPSPAFTNLGSATWDGASQSAGFMLGTEATQTTWLLGDVGEFLVWNVALTAPLLAEAFDYLDRRWNSVCIGH